MNLMIFLLFFFSCLRLLQKPLLQCIQGRIVHKGFTFEQKSSIGNPYHKFSDNCYTNLRIFP